MSSNIPHTHGADCRLAPVSPPRCEDDIPPLKAHFFYSSPIPLDDPLSIPTANDAKSHNIPLRPFSAGDNNALEKTWLGFNSENCRKSHAQARNGRRRAASLTLEDKAVFDAIVQKLVWKHTNKHEKEAQHLQTVTDTPAALPDTTVPVCCSELLIDASAELRNGFCALTRKLQPELDQNVVIERIMSEFQAMRRSHEDMDGASASKRGEEREQSRSRAPSTVRDMTGSLPRSLPVDMSARPSIVDDHGISGMPFVRVGNEAPLQFSPPDSVIDIVGSADRGPSSRREERSGLQRDEKRPSSSRPQRTMDMPEPEIPDEAEHSVDIPVGISRLHQVTLPVLQMKPIYWSPVNDISIVMRATWFYADNAMPVPPEVANQLEAGYRELRPWSETWADELRSALEVGALGEEKVSHRLWPEPLDKKVKPKETHSPEPLISSDPFCAAKCFRGEAAAVGTLEAVQSEDKVEGDGTHEERKPFHKHHVIYKNSREAYLLSPSLQPSGYYGRKPIAKIMRGQIVGTPLIRGFDWAPWEKHHHKRRSQTKKAHGPPGNTESSGASVNSETCPGCKKEQAAYQVTDLVLIAHGIGQKYAERNESFHFTHAVNGFRRAVNAELGSQAVTSVLRPGQNGIMVLPVNWRAILKFDERDSVSEEDQAAQFQLKDIEPKTIPAVRSIISDIMFDIPFYMSPKYKDQMISALVVEANRVYRLWCLNNPGFSDKGRVHLIAHSLGSAMALEILSKQPNTVPPLNLMPTSVPSPIHFEFDTKNLFLLGSPAGFFLLLERGNLIPRRGRQKPGSSQADFTDPDLVGEEGQFGCLAVDNIYNVLAKEDPIAYLLNGTIDPKYASSLKRAYVPSTAASWMSTIMRGITGTAGSTATTIKPTPITTATSQDPDPRKALTARLPSQLELEVHDFVREDIAEKKAYMLNDNGQIDFYLRSGGGPIDVQYLNMLSAHSSYWYNPDLIRMLCMEIGRAPGRRNTLPSLRAVKDGKTVGSSMGK